MERAGKDAAADAVTSPGAPTPRSVIPSPGTAVPVAAAHGTTSPTTTAPGTAARRRLRWDLLTLLIVAVLLVGAGTSTAALAYQNLYSPSAFVLRYLDLLSQGRAADALTVPGVAIQTDDLVAARLPTTASEAMLRADALAMLRDVTLVGTEDRDDVTAVTVTYQAGPHTGTSTFLVERSGWIGVAPTWRFAQSPLAVIDVNVRGSMRFSVNGFEVDKRQVSPDGADADPLASVPLLVFSPGLYSLTVQTAAAHSPGVAVLSDTPAAEIPVQVQAEPTPELIAVVQSEVEQFLTSCTAQEVLQPTGCPFGTAVENRVISPPQWTILSQPTVVLAPSGADWAIRRAPAMAKITVDVQSLYDGTVSTVEEEVPFEVVGRVVILADGTASITVTSAE